VKNYLGVVPVDEDGSAYFEVPSGRAVYLQALDADGRLIQSMRTFVQAAPGTTRSCIGAMSTSLRRQHRTCPHPCPSPKGRGENGPDSRRLPGTARTHADRLKPSRGALAS